MADVREDILNKEYLEWVNEKGVASIYPDHFPEAYKEPALFAMDERGRQMCLDLLEYMAKHNVMCGISDDGSSEFFYKGQLISKNELFENFL